MVVNTDKKDLQEIVDLLDKKLDEKLDTIKSQLDENTQILKALVHSLEVVGTGKNKVDNDIDIENIKNDIKNINENIDAIKTIIGRHQVDIKVLKGR
ncbi:hypothetical protein AB8U03_16155 [Clostridium sp. Mt-5]|uniref:Uncharacterized protein n=1 Tax=Clostridium moutaii TaxID=3240932 RepID=A0ABV4BSE1_9CLOT